MIDGISAAPFGPKSAALSGLQSASARLGVSAHNVANLGTENVRPLRALQSARPGGGSQVEVFQEPDARPVDLASEIVEQMLASVQYEASLRVLDVESDLKGRLVDLTA